MAQQLDRLTQQERDLLKLLAQGHTAKTIANAEGLSVNAVNERLRSARRKTGAVSSRELARLIGEKERRPAQENRDNLFGVEPPSSDDHRSTRQGPASGAGSRTVWKTLMIAGILGLAGLAAFVTSTPGSPERGSHPPFPVLNGAPAVREWRVMSSAANAPAITYLVPSAPGSSVSIPTVVLSCRSSLRVGVRGFTPADSWPQPVLRTRIGGVERTGSPEVTASGERPALGYSFAIADEVLEPLGRGEPISFEFNGETVEVPTIPQAQREKFVERCAALVHPGMRRRGAAGSRVY